MDDEVKEPSLAFEVKDKFFTYADYLLFQTEERFEIFKGMLLKMSPGPSRTHQSVSMKFSGIFYNFFTDHKCKVFAAPFDVRFINLEKQSKKDKDVDTVLQPDLCIICEEEKLDERGCIGAPDLVVEILSPGNSKKELDKKYDIYEEQGVREYWLVHPIEKIIWQYVLKDGRFIGLKPITEEDTVVSHIFPKLTFQAAALFD